MSQKLRLWTDLKSLLIGLAGSSLGLFFLLNICYFSKRLVCLPRNFNASIFSILFFPLVVIICYWVGFRIIGLLKK